MAKGHWRAAHIPKSSKKRRFTDAQRASYRAGFKAGVKFGKARVKGDLRKHAKREGWY